MFGLAAGSVRMVLDFTYREPLCMEPDTRPFLVSGLHYMYFAAGLFLASGLVGVVVSLSTQPPRDYMVSHLIIVWTDLSLAACADHVPDAAGSAAAEGRT